MSVSRRLCLAALAALALGVAQSAHADTLYTVTDLGTLPGKANSWTWIQTLNNRGAVAAYANNTADPNAFVGDAAFLWYHGKTIPLPGLPGATDTIATSLNDHNQVVGFSGADGFHPVRAVLWDKGKVIDLGTYGDDPFSKALGINNHSQVVGYSYTFDYFFGGEHALLWERGKVYPLAPLPGAPASYAGGINNKGQIVGGSGPTAVLWKTRQCAPIDLGVFGGAFLINDREQITGISWDQNYTRSRAFLWDRGVTTYLEALRPDDPVALPYGMNDKGQIVGQSSPTYAFNNVTDASAVLWEHGTVIDLDTRIPAGSGWKLLAANGINERGQIAGFGVHNGQLRAFLLTPTKK